MAMKTPLEKFWPYLLGGTLLSLYLLLAGYLTATVREPQPDTQNDKRKIRLTLAVPAGIKTAAIYREHVRRFEERNPQI
jgi:hypothetical protein